MTTSEPASDRASEPAVGLPNLTSHATDMLHITVGLGILGLQQFQANRESIEEKLEALGLAPAAILVRLAAKALDEPVQWLLARSHRR